MGIGRGRRERGRGGGEAGEEKGREFKGKRGKLEVRSGVGRREVDGQGSGRKGKG